MVFFRKKVKYTPINVGTFIGIISLIIVLCFLIAAINDADGSLIGRKVVTEIENIRSSSISGYIYLNLNTKNPAGNISLSLYNVKNSIYTHLEDTVTSQNGQYKFSDIKNKDTSTYAVFVNPIAAYSISNMSDTPSLITLKPNQKLEGPNFSLNGIKTSVSVQGHICKGDVLKGTCLQNDNDILLLAIYNSGGNILYIIKSSTDGSYLVTGLGKGTYKIGIVSMPSSSYSFIGSNFISINGNSHIIGPTFIIQQ